MFGDIKRVLFCFFFSGFCVKPGKSDYRFVALCGELLLVDGEFSIVVFMIEEVKDVGGERMLNCMRGVVKLLVRRGLLC